MSYRHGLVKFTEEGIYVSMNGFKHALSPAEFNGYTEAKIKRKAGKLHLKYFSNDLHVSLYKYTDISVNTTSENKDKILKLLDEIQEIVFKRCLDCVVDMWRITESPFLKKALINSNYRKVYTFILAHGDDLQIQPKAKKYFLGEIKKKLSKWDKFVLWCKGIL